MNEYQMKLFLALCEYQWKALQAWLDLIDEALDDGDNKTAKERAEEKWGMTE